MSQFLLRHEFEGMFLKSPSVNFLKRRPLKNFNPLQLDFFKWRLGSVYVTLRLNVNLKGCLSFKKIPYCAVLFLSAIPFKIIFFTPWRSLSS